MSNKYRLPLKIIPYLKRILVEYEQSDEKVYVKIINSSHIFIREATEPDWVSDMYGHDVIFFLPLDIQKKITLEMQNEYRKNICEKLRICTSSSNDEYFNNVYFEVEDENDPEYQQAISIYERPLVDPDSLLIWEPNQIRLFISHKDEHRAEAKELADALRVYGVSAFVAHDSIEPMTTWPKEILNALETMEIMLAFITDDFHKSIWTNQELGFALGRSVPIISLKFGQANPKGFISQHQALTCRLDDSASSAVKIYKLLADKLGNQERLQKALISAFVESPDFFETVTRFDRMSKVIKKLSQEEIKVIVDGFRKNDQLYNSGYLTNDKRRLERFLNLKAGHKFTIKGEDITLVQEDAKDMY